MAIQYTHNSITVEVETEHQLFNYYQQNEQCIYLFYLELEGQGETNSM